MKNKLHIFSSSGSAFLFLFYLLLSLWLMQYNDVEALRNVRLIMLKLVAWENSMENKFALLQDRAQENKILRQKNLALAVENQRLQESLIENIRLRKLLQFKKDPAYRYISSRVIGYGAESAVQSIVLDVGKNEGIYKNYPVITPEGLVGKIILSEPEQSIAQILLDRNMLVSARLQKSREVGVVAWTGNFWLNLNYVPKHVAVEPGELVITSGLSRIYPKGIKIGVVAEVEEDQYNLFKRIKVKPAVNFNSLEEVFVLAPQDSLTESGGSR
ncbi:MAG: rod shape-determining protein MreC [Calditrichia bacterium]